MRRGRYAKRRWYLSSQHLLLELHSPATEGLPEWELQTSACRKGVIRAALRRKEDVRLIASMMLVCAVLMSLAAGVLVAYSVCLTMFHVFRMHALQIQARRALGDPVCATQS